MGAVRRLSSRGMCSPSREPALSRNGNASFSSSRGLVADPQVSERERSQRKTRIEIVAYDPAFEGNSTTERDDGHFEASELFEIATRKARLTDFEVDLVKKGISGEETRETLAREYGVTVYRIEQLIRATTVELCKLCDEPVKGEVESCPLLFYAAE